jgi:hypothetical protein
MMIKNTLLAFVPLLITELILSVTTSAEPITKLPKKYYWSKHENEDLQSEIFRDYLDEDTEAISLNWNVLEHDIWYAK